MRQDGVLHNTTGRRLPFEHVLADFEDFILRSPEGRLHDFVISAVEKPLIEMVLYRTRGNQSKAARILGINRNTLHTKIKKLGINVEQWH
ncbi:MAG: Fis family transcriptional regulator [Candidatus Omnitrophica bacterium]|nr:Fis family transcriptional regulator [Candidatus Omnitrophota bacterium]